MNTNDIRKDLNLLNEKSKPFVSEITEDDVDRSSTLTKKDIGKFALYCNDAISCTYKNKEDAEKALKKLNESIEDHTGEYETLLTEIFTLIDNINSTLNIIEHSYYNDHEGIPTTDELLYLKSELTNIDNRLNKKDEYQIQESFKSKFKNILKNKI